MSTAKQSKFSNGIEKERSILNKSKQENAEKVNALPTNGPTMTIERFHGKKECMRAKPTLFLEEFPFPLGNRWART